MIASLLHHIWYNSRFMGLFLAPLAWLFRALSAVRRFVLQRSQASLSTPVIVVGNINIGGTGKTPLLMAIVQHLQQQGLKPAVISRGYGGHADYPYALTENSTADQAGDEPLMIYQHCHCPVVVAPKRLAAARYIEQHCDVDVIVSDDGLQHYALPRDVEIVVIDAARGLGNGLCLPAGPLRESPRRLQQVDMIVTNGETRQCYHPAQFAMQLKPVALEPLTPHCPMPMQDKSVHGVAGIGHPPRFFATLQALGFNVTPHPFVDHYHYQAADLQFDDQRPVVMTEKDAVKCRQFDHLDRHYYLPVSAVLPETFWQQLDKQLQAITKV